MRAEQAAETLGGLDRRVGIRRSLQWNDQPVIRALMVALGMMMNEILSHSIAERALAEEDQSVEASMSNGH